MLKILKLRLLQCEIINLNKEGYNSKNGQKLAFYQNASVFCRKYANVFSKNTQL